MRTTRRTFLGAVGATAALGVATGAKLSRGAGDGAGHTEATRSTGRKVLFWVAASTPCDKT